MQEVRCRPETPPATVGQKDVLPHDDRPSAVIIAKNSVSPMLYSSGFSSASPMLYSSVSPMLYCFSSACDLLDEEPAVWGNEDGRNSIKQLRVRLDPSFIVQQHDHFVLRLQEESFMQKSRAADKPPSLCEEEDSHTIVVSYHVFITAIRICFLPSTQKLPTPWFESFCPWLLW